MNLEQAKQDAAAVFTELKNALENVETFLYEDLDIPEEPIRINFAGWSDVDSYEDDLKSKRLELLKTIAVVKIFQNTTKDSTDLINWMLLDLNFQHFFTNTLTHEIPYPVELGYLNKLHHDKLVAFEMARKEFRSTLSSKLQDELNTSDKSNKSRAKINKLVWQGEQYHLVELFRTLIARKWIKSAIGDTPTSNARAILEAFDISLTKKKPTSDEAESFIKSYIGEGDKNENLYPGNPEFSKMKNYKTYFDEIKERPQSNSEK